MPPFFDMDITLKINKSADNTINKVFESALTFTNCKLKSNVDIVDPIIYIHSDTYLNYNYAEIPEFNRSYFINNIAIFPKGLYELRLHVDVLESFKTDILASSAWIKQSTEINNYYDDGNYLSEVKKEIKIYKSAQYIDLNYENIIMVTSGAK